MTHVISPGVGTAVNGTPRTGRHPLQNDRQTHPVPPCHTRSLSAPDLHACVTRKHRMVQLTSAPSDLCPRVSKHAPPCRSPPPPHSPDPAAGQRQHTLEPQSHVENADTIGQVCSHTGRSRYSRPWHGAGLPCQVGLLRGPADVTAPRSLIQRVPVALFETKDF